MGVRRTWLALALASVGLLAGCTSLAEPDDDGDGRPNSQDCDDGSPQVWRSLELYADTDGDGFGEGERQRLCVGEPLPRGLVLAGGDCAPGDTTRWRSVAGVFRDADGDGATVGAAQTACVGAELTGYVSKASASEDCDDTRPQVFRAVTLYRDVDGDGFGAELPEALCVDERNPTGYVATGTDCAPEEASRWRLLPYSLRDADGDGWTVALSGAVCTGTSLPPGYPQVARGNDCDDSARERWQARSAYVDTDGDGFGAGPQVIRCMGATMEAGHADRGEDCAPGDSNAWQWLSYNFRDKDLDGATVAEQGVLCGDSLLPQGYALTPSGADCDDSDDTVLVSWDVFRDEDGDGTGAGTREAVCAGRTVPRGYSTSGTDCAETDASRWRMLEYAYRDADGDTHTIPEAGSVCAGQGLPSGYTKVAHGSDCDDSRPAVYVGLTTYEDSDGDGVGAGSAVAMCTDGSLPEGYSRSGTDCAPTEAGQWQRLTYGHVDSDSDGYTTPSPGELCVGPALPSGYFTVATGNDCDDSDNSLFRWVVAYADKDGDTVGAGKRSVPCLGTEWPSGSSRLGYDVDDADPLVTEDAELDELDALVLGL